MSANTKFVTLSVARLNQILAVSAIALSCALPVAAEDAGWKENFAACAGNTPFIEALLNQHNEGHRPLLRIGEMQAWAIQDESGKPTIALTTEDGLTIIGRILGPQGEDISRRAFGHPAESLGSLLCQRLVLGLSQRHRRKSKRRPKLQPCLHLRETQADATPPPSGSVSPSLERMLAETQTLATLPPDDAVTTTATVSNPVATAPIAAAAAPTPEVQAGMNAIFNQADQERIWFSAATPKEGAPVVYMLADPECPHCQWTIDKMRSQIVSGEIDLRIIFAPITGVAGFNTSLSILHSEDIPNTFMEHMTSNTPRHRSRCTDGRERRRSRRRSGHRRQHQLDADQSHARCALLSLSDRRRRQVCLLRIAIRHPNGGQIKLMAADNEHIAAAESLLRHARDL